MTQIGTSPNIVVSRVREEITGTPFTMFDFTPVGLALTAARLHLPDPVLLDPAQRTRRGRAVARSVGHQELLARSEGRNGFHHRREDAGGSAQDSRGRDCDHVDPAWRQPCGWCPFPTPHCSVGDVLLIEGDPQALDRLVARTQLSLSDKREIAKEARKGAETTSIEAVIGENSSLIGWSAKNLLAARSFQREPARGQPQRRAAGSNAWGR